MSNPLDRVVPLLYRYNPRSGQQDMVERVPFETVVAWPDDVLLDRWTRSRSGQHVFNIARIYTPSLDLVRVFLPQLDIADDVYGDDLRGIRDSLREAVDGHPHEAVRAVEDAQRLLHTAATLGLKDTYERALAAVRLAYLARPRADVALHVLPGPGTRGFSAAMAPILRDAAAPPTWERILSAIEQRAR